RRSADDLEGGRILLGLEMRYRKPTVCVATCRAQHAWAVGGDPDLGILPAVGRQIEYRVAQREERRVPGDQFTRRRPECTNGGQGFDCPCDWLRPVHAVRLVPFPLSGPHAPDAPPPRKQM